MIQSTLGERALIPGGRKGHRLEVPEEGIAQAHGDSAAADQ